MIFKIVCLIVLLNNVWCAESLTDEVEDVSYNMNSGNAPFFELPCMIVGGVCARSVACPSGTYVGASGLCPAQQEQGMECCRPKVESEVAIAAGEREILEFDSQVRQSDIGIFCN